MTNTLHRYGDAASFEDDYVVFAIPCRGKNDIGALPKLKKFLELALSFGPVNLGDARHGGAIRAARDPNPLIHWKREVQPDFRAVIDGLDTPGAVAAVFDNRAAAQDFVHAVKEANLGLSVNISTSVDGAGQCCHGAGLKRHSIGYSLGFEGKTVKLPAPPVLTLTTMCGHSMISPALAGKMVDWVREGRRTPQEAAACLSRFCTCGVFNPCRARRVLEDARGANR